MRNNVFNVQPPRRSTSRSAHRLTALRLQQELESFIPPATLAKATTLDEVISQMKCLEVVINGKRQAMPSADWFDTQIVSTIDFVIKRNLVARIKRVKC
jgi:hypothetical protein